MRRAVTSFSVLFLLLAPILGALTCKTYEAGTSSVIQDYIVLETVGGERIFLKNSYCPTDPDDSNSDHDSYAKGHCSYCQFSNSYPVFSNSYLDISSFLVQNVPLGSLREESKEPSLSTKSARAPPVSA